MTYKETFGFVPRHALVSAKHMLDSTTFKMTKGNVNLDDAGSVKELIRDMHGMYDEQGNWLTIDSGEIIGVVKLVSNAKPCAVILKAPYQSINGVYLDDDMKLHISEWSIGGVFWGELTQENVDNYNDSITSEGSKIKSFVTM